MIIENGVGNGNKLRVDANNRAHVQSIQENESVHSTELGDAYNINTGQISFTADGTLIYFKNDEDRDFVVEAIALGTDGGGNYCCTCVCLRPFITLVRNPTGGDLISDASAVAMNANRNFGSNKSLSSTTLAYKGKSGGTLTGGDDIAILQSSQAGRDFFTINFILPKGSSLGVKVTNGLASGTAKIYAAIVGYLKDPEGKDS
jgi:hypothetical protein